MASTGVAQTTGKSVNGGRFDFDDGGTYCGGWEDGKAHGHGVCTGPKGQGEYSGSWHFGFEVSGVYTWPSGSTYEGQWQNGKRHGLGTESRGRWVYRGEWTQGFKGRYGVRQSTSSAAKYEGTWANGLQDGYGSETYADSGTYKGQWLRGQRHGYGVRTSAPFGQASIHKSKAGGMRGSTTSLRSDSAGDPAAERDRKMDESRGGFVLRSRSDEVPVRRRSLVERGNIKNVFKMRRQRSTGDIQTRGTGSIRSTGSSASWMSSDSAQSAYTTGDAPDEGSNASFIIEVGLDEQMDANVVETYMGEWKNDRRCGFGSSERSDGLRYEGEWYNNKKYGYGVTTFKDGSKEEGKYKNNVLITSQKKKHLFLIRSAKFRERIEAAVAAAQRAGKIAMQKDDIAISRTATARGKAEQADVIAHNARQDTDVARIFAKQFAPDFQQPGPDGLKAHLAGRGGPPEANKIGIPKGNADPSTQARVKYGREVENEMDMKSNALGPSYEVDSMIPPPGGGRPPPPSVTTAPPQIMQKPKLPPAPGGNFAMEVMGSLPSDSNRRPSMNPPLPSSGTSALASTALESITTPKHNVFEVLETPNQQHQQNQPLTQHQQMPPQPPLQLPQRNSLQQHNPLPPPRQEVSLGMQNMNATPMDLHDTGAMIGNAIERGRASVKGPQPGSRRVSSITRAEPIGSTNYNFNSVMNDHFEQYKRPPSRDRSVDRWGSRCQTPVPNELINPRSRAPSAQRSNYATDWTPDSGVFDDEGSATGSRRPTFGPADTGTPLTGNGSVGGMGTPYYIPSTQTEAEKMLRQRACGQEILHCPPTPGQGSVKRTESLYINPIKRAQAQQKQTAPTPSLKRKKSLPEVQPNPNTPLMSRDEVSYLSSNRRQAVRKEMEDAERYRANPLLYLTSPNVQDWFSRQRLVMLILLVNLSLALMFFKLLT